ncbi:serine/threonine-protein kinase [Actinomadura syzygii]|uniref:non-specific serine/threonine protein kinase n=1 Tax=Actinomadura syzygii TaxID=1427538 RepID=A0A5D0UK60_9ACTN|nr:serine/threonine-protein kinase [Actinomadura syzygii]TYC17529.1 serine/threonine protein kinase [Actinomadura syzygii]
MRLGAEVGGRYRLIKGPIRGGTGEVWLADDPELGRRVALKRARLDGVGPGAFDRLRSEARALARFSHPHVVTLYDAVRVRTGDEDTSWLVLEYVPGGSLDAWPPMRPESAARVGAQIASALSALHAEGIVHCDVKPGNIVVTDDGTAKLTDFGAAYRFGGRETVTRNGAVSHTPAYAAPEVVRGRPEPASDVFSLGATVQALVTGAPPGDPAARAADLGPLAGVVAALLRPEPGARPAPAEARRLLEEVAGPAEPERPGYAAPTEDESSAAVRTTQPWRRPVAFARRHPVAVSAAGAVVALGVALAIVIPSSGGTAPAKPKPKPVSLIGDPRTADPCALTDPSALRKFGGTELDNDYGNFDRCDVLVSTGGDGEVDVKFDLDTGGGPETAGPARTIGRVRVVEDRAEDDFCGRILVLPPPDAGTTIVVDAHQTQGRPVPLCPIAETAAVRAVAALNRAPLARRSPPFPARSLAHRNACAMIGPGALDIVPGVDAAEPDVGFGGWGCEWGSTTRDIDVHLFFDRGQPPTAADDGNPTRLRGRPAFVQPKGDGDGTCVVRVVHRTYSDQHGDEAAELLYLVARGAPPVKELCAMATTLADAAAAQLPA